MCRGRDALCLMARSARRASRWETAFFVIARRRKACRLVPCTLLAPLAEAGARWPLHSSLARRRKACLLAHSSRTAARQPGSARRRAMRYDEDASEGQYGPVRPDRVGLVEQLLIIGNELLPMIIGQCLQHRSCPGA
jgi:hypothetical protein